MANKNHNGQIENDPDNEFGSDTLITDLLTTEDDVFRRVFIGPYTSEQQFVHSMPFIALDGTYLRNCFKHTLLLAVGRNRNNKSWILAFAIVESENNKSWAWFLERLVKYMPLLTDDYTKGQKPYCISDRNQLLLKAIEKYLPCATDVYCCWHLIKNILNVITYATRRQ